MSTDTFSQNSDPRDAKRYYLENNLVRRLTTALAKRIFSLLATVETCGVENLPASGPVVLAANHVTNFDVFPMQFVLPRLIFYMGKAELFRNPLLDVYLRRLGAFPVERGAKDQWAIRHAQKVLEHGQMMGIFPEGKRSKGHGLRAAKTGAARLAIATQAPVVPLSVAGTHRIFKNFPKRCHIIIKIGVPILPQPNDTVLELTDRIMFAIAEMLPLEQRGVYSHKPPGF